MTEIMFDENEDWEKRILCSDESCIGTIGPEGLCRECGKSYKGAITAGFAEKKEQTITPNEKQAPAPAENNDDDWDKRVLCGDEACIGVIGPDGFCKECGKPLQ